ncbi:MAG: hypothetical protein FWG55_01560 [Candidatus Bathyarchaeota archaeon]|nr:hypothetical protein [Candidatus Termiticorpusculum sp.]
MTSNPRHAVGLYHVIQKSPLVSEYVEAESNCNYKLVAHNPPVFVSSLQETPTQKNNYGQGIMLDCHCSVDKSDCYRLYLTPENFEDYCKMFSGNMINPCYSPRFEYNVGSKKWRNWK